MLPAFCTADEDAATPASATAGPWSGDLQHGGGPAGLVAWAAEQLQAPQPMRLARLTVGLLRPAPLRPPAFRVHAVRDGKQIQVAQIGLFDGGTEVVRAMALRVRASELGMLAATDDATVDPPPDVCGAPGSVDHLWSPFLEGIDTRDARGSLLEIGPPAVLYRLHRPVVAGVPLSPASRAAIAADFTNGTSAPLDPAVWTFVNSDTTLHLERDPVGESILVDASIRIQGNGSGLAIARLADRAGTFGRASLSLVVSKR